MLKTQKRPDRFHGAPAVERPSAVAGCWTGRSKRRVSSPMPLFDGDLVLDAVEVGPRQHPLANQVIG
jgi:hypothetical protein